MQQRRVRLGDILDDYCPRERRITNHAVVAMIEDEVKQTRCTTCDADHEYKQARVPASRRKKATGVLTAGAPDAPSLAPPPVAATDPPVVDEVIESPMDEPFVEPPAAAAAAAEAVPVVTEPDVPVESENPAVEDEWPVHRPLIRATLPRPEGQAPERKEPDFTIRQNGRFDRNGNRNRGRHGRGPGHGSGQSRFNQSHSGSGHAHRSGSGSGHGHGQHSGQGSRPGNRPGPSGQRGGGGRSGGQGRGPNSGQGRGRRGR
jgi:hypothetical protein